MTLIMHAARRWRVKLKKKRYDGVKMRIKSPDKQTKRLTSIQGTYDRARVDVIGS